MAGLGAAAAYAAVAMAIGQVRTKSALRCCLFFINNVAEILGSFCHTFNCQLSAVLVGIASHV
jgi:hypothetical protein